MYLIRYFYINIVLYRKNPLRYFTPQWIFLILQYRLQRHVHQLRMGVFCHTDFLKKYLSWFGREAMTNPYTEVGGKD